MTKVDLITGILGSGKTTFIRQYARHLMAQGQRIAILENDFGAVNVDTLMLQELKAEGCHMATIAGGCDADCHKRRFKTQLIALGMQHFDRVLIEPSGIYDMDEFFDTLYESPLDRWFSVGSVLCIADASLTGKLSQSMAYLLASEAASCGKLIVSKMDARTEAERMAQGKALLTYLNQALEGIQCSRRFSMNEVCLKPWQDFNAEDFTDFAQAGYRSAAYVKQFNRDELGSDVCYFMNIALPLAQAKEMLQTIFEDETCGHVHRIKGALPDETGGWLRINATAQQMETSSADEGQPVLIVIGESLNYEAIDRYFRQWNTDPAYTSIG